MDVEDASSKLYNFESRYVTYFWFRIIVTFRLSFALNGLPFLQRVHIARIADRCNSQSDSVCPPSVTFWCFLQTNEDTIVPFSASVVDYPSTRNVIKYIN